MNKSKTKVMVVGDEQVDTKIEIEGIEIEQSWVDYNPENKGVPVTKAARYTNPKQNMDVITPATVLTFPDAPHRHDLLITNEVSSLKITDLRVPSKATNDALLDCRYDLEGELLYDVKWYKDNQQFFRCIPGQAVQYDMDGIKIYFEKFPSMGSCPFTLTNLSPKAEGEYKCEVSTEGPSFKTEVAYSRLRVVPISQIPDKNKQAGKYERKELELMFDKHHV
ncbi:beat protein [Holotrichia oblita]|uniref:Beat protein n=1 Tax=Holotrichia oblita TaxID=644536 RepID=A0ACB9TXX5_HOLOL|nr:beat protein [Holotrichia oblita]